MLRKRAFAHIIFIFVLHCTASTHGATIIYASSLGCASNLLVIDPTGTEVILDINLTISPSCPLTLVGNAGNLTFSATGNQQLIISSSTQWNISSLQKPNTLFFTGNAQFIMQPGAQLLADQATGVTIEFQDNALWGVVP